MSADPYVDPRTGVLLNTLGIVDAEELACAEADITAFALYRLERQSLPGKYDLAHLCAFHIAIFKDVYPWAGECRTIATAKGDIFCLPQFIESFATDVFEGLAREGHLLGLARAEFVDRMTYFFGEVNALHPFREGNGRTQRAFWGQLAHDAGYPIRWERLDQQRNIDASVAIMRGNAEPMRAVFEELIAAE